MTDFAKAVVREVVTESPRGVRGQAQLRVREWSEDERLRRAIVRLLVWWGATVVAALVPPHLAWLALGLLTGPIAAWFVLRDRGTIERTALPCPACGTASEVEEQPATWPVAARCRECRDVFAIHRADQEMPATAAK